MTVGLVVIGSDAEEYADLMLSVEPDNTIDSIKEMVQGILGVPAGQQHVVVDDVELFGFRTLSELP